MNKNKVKRNVSIVLLIILIIILYLLLLKFGHIEHYGPKVPTGNVDVFEIQCECKTDCKAPVDSNSDINDNNQNSNVNKPYTNDQSLDVMAYDNYKIYDTKHLRIFENPAFKYNEIIAPGSENSYDFIIKNNSDFDIYADIVMQEENKYGFHMQYKLKNKGKYIVGSKNSYVDPTKLQVNKVLIKANSSISYTLDWKWIDSDNDTNVGINEDSVYQLDINITAVKA